MQLNDITNEILQYIKTDSPSIIALHGTLGAGKTFLVNHIAEELSVGRKLQSPTFTLLQEYHIPQHSHKKRIIHCDFYRIDEQKAAETLEQLGFWDYITPETVLFIEWPEKLGSLLSAFPSLQVAISHEDNVRNYTIYA
jgi:tRNA threonylcarbamoyladenosine biosynthesis protein TsaE